MYVHYFKYSKKLPVLGIGVVAVNQDGFFDGFSRDNHAPSFVAHLAIVKEQSRESIKEDKSNTLGDGHRCNGNGPSSL